jgi:hypothetical protein
MSLAMNATHYAEHLHLTVKTMCMTVWPNVCLREIFVFRLHYNNNISCIPIYFLHASAPSVSDRGQIIDAKWDSQWLEGNVSKFNSLT